jgi:DNA-binding PadR family transcriptional regulator
MGRAGRGNTPGRAVVLKRPNDTWQIEDLRRQLEEERLPPFRSAFELQGSLEGAANIRKTAELIASLLSRLGKEGLTAAEIETFFSRSLGGQGLSGQVQPALRMLVEDTLAFVADDKFKLTALGDEATRAVLPSQIAAGFAQLIRDFLSIDPDDRYLGQWQPTDHLIVLNLLDEGIPKI